MVIDRQLNQDVPPSQLAQMSAAGRIASYGNPSRARVITTGDGNNGV
jgi:hypothetical protein